MKTLLWFLALYLIILLGLAALGIVFGFLFHWILPRVDLGMGILIGVVLVGLSIHFFSSLVTFLNRFENELQNKPEEADRGFPSYDPFDPLPNPWRRRKKGT